MLHKSSKVGIDSKFVSVGTGSLPASLSSSSNDVYDQSTKKYKSRIQSPD